MGRLIDLYIEERRKRQDHDDYIVFKRRDPHIRDIWAYAEATASAGLPQVTTANASALVVRAIL